MAGTDSSREDLAAAAGPAIVLVEPQLGENIGACARAMLNCGLTDLRLVRPRDGWPNPKAEAMASGATAVLERARVYDTTAEACADLSYVLATTARTRDMKKPALTPRAAAGELRARIGSGQGTGVLFGPERAGLVNEDVTLADAVLSVPLNPAFSSLNLAQAVLLIGYEWYQAGDATPASALMDESSPPATVATREFFLARLEALLEEAGFFYPEHIGPTMKRNLRTLFTRAGMSDQEVQTLHGVLRALSEGPRRRTRTD
ncbi:tRNA (cytidine/uridine-2'-O-)-methyltransferase TrmJ [Thalassobaculum fulvum]|uniref:tRNA (cytidine/uridine-2'-O-)-methyltransferase TrmJ n=1 Tax=Thalassobaculum fulvum TaxID=1633335 RepID=A0A919CS95_9PROT|nr:RNA methyltransferase [Thalassobaculum fulvum]GHD61391.1 tRNA (cytidine/uridine-2'-O-)-methyltransferase TrmJ [Thalassobaculum fulvum]